MIEEVHHVLEWVDGRGKCPYSHRANSSALMTVNGEYYIGSATDFSGTDHAIYRMSGPHFGDLLRTSQVFYICPRAVRRMLYLKPAVPFQLNPLWLSRPNFVGAFDVGNFVYFFFRETAVEYTNCGKAIYSRVARVCKNDRGELKDTWATFLKARLNCSLPGDYPFYFDEIQSVFYLEAEATFYATFSTPENAIPGSAVCAFSLSDVERAFDGPFKKQARADANWGPVTADHAKFQCRSNSLESPSATSREYQLVDNAVQPALHGPIYHVR